MNRGTYCILSVMSLLALPLESPPDSPAKKHGFEKLTDGVPEYIARCKCTIIPRLHLVGQLADNVRIGQTYEGGISGSPGTEAHGALTFCALAALCILGEPQEMCNRSVQLRYSSHTHARLAWLL